MDALLRLKEQGKIREIGVSNYGVLDIDTVLTYNVVVSNQLAYNMLFRGIEYSVLPKSWKTVSRFQPTARLGTWAFVGQVQ